jgi:hypothetical protein
MGVESQGNEARNDLPFTKDRLFFHITAGGR